jgi:hypothetical protein
MFGSQWFGSGGGTTEGAVTFTGKAGSSSNATSYTISVACGDGGDMVVAAYGQSGGDPSVTTFTLDGQTITVKAYEKDDSEVALYIGTCSGVSSGDNDCVVGWNRSMYRTMIFVWKVEDVGIGAMRQAVSAEAYNDTMSAYQTGSVVIAATGSDSGTTITGSSGLTFNGNQFNESNMAGASAVAADASTSFSFAGADGNRPLIVGLELSTEDSDTTYRYWRLSIAVGHNANEVAVGELAIFVSTTQYPTAMTNDTAPSPLVATGSSRDNATRSYWKAFNRVTTGSEPHWASAYQAAFPQYVQVDLGSGNGIAATSYSITAGRNGKESQAPKTFTLQGSHDGSTFSDINTQTNVASWSEAEERTYTI